MLWKNARDCFKIKLINAQGVTALQVTRQGEFLTVDIHGMYCEQAKERLLWLFGHQCKGIAQVRVVHGYHGGQVLRDMVRKELRHPRIQRKILSMNDGETIFVLKKENPKK